MNAGAGREAPLFAICYDIGSDLERRRVDRLLSAYGHRQQRSLFECRLPPSSQLRLREQLAALSLRTGHVRMYRVYAGTATHTVGVTPKDPDSVHCYTI